MQMVRIGDLPDSAVEASQIFYAEYLPAIRETFSHGGGGGDVMLVFGKAGHNHRAWRTAITGELARDNVPARVNAIAATSEAEIAAMTAYLSEARGITGQYFECDGEAAGNPLA